MLEALRATHGAAIFEYLSVLNGSVWNQNHAVLALLAESRLLPRLVTSGGALAEALVRTLPEGAVLLPWRVRGELHFAAHGAGDTGEPGRAVGRGPSIASASCSESSGNSDGSTARPPRPW